ncbi:GroES-like protein [Dentipellis sp. KUC8613]|nr:GroES-like protein [Dentipellis sp. KUC8613]
MAQQLALLLPEKHGEYTVGPRPIPTPGPGDVLIEVHAAGLNGIDNYIRLVGAFIDAYPAVTGHEGVGVVKAVGKDVRDIMEGDRVLFECWFSADRGTYQQYSLADARGVTKIPDSLSFDDAATLPVSFATAAVGLYAPKSKRGGAGLTPFWEDGGRGKYASEPIVILGGSSCVGQLTIQLAKLSGFNPIISTCSTHNIDYVKQAGATHVIDYKETSYADLPAAIARITSKPCRLVYDAISTEETQKTGWSILAPNGSICVLLPPHVGKYGEEAEDGKRTVYVFGNVNDPEHQNSGFGSVVAKTLEKLLAEGTIRPTRVEVVPGGLHGIQTGLERLMTGKVSGAKLIVHPQ